MASEDFASVLEGVVRDASSRLGVLGFRSALVGGLAVSARSEPRFTRDADFAVAVTSDREAETLIRDLQASGYRTLTLLEQETSGRLATVRLQPPDGEVHGVILDLLFASSGIEPEIVNSASTLEVFPRLELPVAEIGDLLALKILARNDETRPQDAFDIRVLLREAREGDLNRARQSLVLIAERGYHRGRDLIAELERVL